jgi:anti-sigma factor RsiW
MNCSQARKWIPLYAGADLSAGKFRHLEKHLEGCANCRTEVEEHKAALAGLQMLANHEALDWPEAEWKALMARVKSEMPGRRRGSLMGATPRRAWAYGFAAVLFLGIVGLILRSRLSPTAKPLFTEIVAFTPAPPARSLKTEEAFPASDPRDVPFQIRRSRLETVERATLAGGPASGKAAQDMLSLTLISQETGFKVHWTLNRNFEWEEKKQ